MKNQCTRLAACLLLFFAGCSSHSGGSGYRIALVPARSGQHGLFVVNADTSGSKLLSADLNVQLRPTSWSPDGGRIAFLSYRTGDRSRVPTDFPLYVMDAGGGNQKRLTDFTVSNFGWSPDCQRMFVISASEDPESDDPDIKSGKKSASSAIYLFDLRSGERRQVSALGKRNFAAWSPDGTRLAFSSGNDIESDVYVVGVDGQHARRLTDSRSLYFHPSWSPDGKSIAYLAAPVTGSDGQEFGAFVADAGGGNNRRVAELVCYDIAWSPDGKLLLLQSAAGLYLFAVPQAALSKLNVGTDRPLDAVFTPEGRRIMFRSNHEGEWYLYSVDLNGGNRRKVIGQLTASSFCLSPLSANN